MSMQSEHSQIRAERPCDKSDETARTAKAQRRALSPRRVGEILGAWQTAELRIARGFTECRGLSTEQLEDLYQETALALYCRPYTSEEHLRNALRTGVKQRALRLHRDERRRIQILARNAPGLNVIAEAREGQRAPEPAVIAQQDRLIAKEFLTELTASERRVFGWLVEGLRYRAIATVEGIPVNEARSLARACERKRERFQLLYDTGRLCGYRAMTIRALQNGQTTSEELAEQAFAHLESCVHCRLEHKTSAGRLRRSFREKAAALLPPVLLGHLGWLTRLSVRARLLLHRLAPLTGSVWQSALRERSGGALLTSSGLGAKIAAGLVTIGVLAGGAVAAHNLEHRPPAHQPRRRDLVIAPSAEDTRSSPARNLSPGAVEARTSAHGNAESSRGSRRAPNARRWPTVARPSTGGRETDGFAYLGVPTTRGAPVIAQMAASGSEEQRGGGPFGP